MKEKNGLQDSVHVNIGTAQIENNKCQKLLGIYSKLTFENHINHICAKAKCLNRICTKAKCLNLNDLRRILYYMDTLKRRLLVNAFFAS